MLLTREDIANIIKNNADDEGATISIPTANFNSLIQQLYDLQIERFEKHRQTHMDTFNEKCKLESQCREFKKRIATLQLNRIADLKAFQMFIDVMKGGTTHREKECFAHQASKTIEDKISEIMSTLFTENLISSGDDLPF